jgi:SsrA-binding protein
MVDYLIVNKRLLFDYNVHQTFEAGIVLTGCEVKSIRKNHVGINDCYIVIKNNEVLALNWNIPKYTQSFSDNNYDPRRPKRLLLRKSEIRRIIGLVKREGYSMVVSKIYTNKHGFFKFEIALVTGKKKYDKRQYIRKKDERRESIKKFND